MKKRLIAAALAVLVAGPAQATGFLDGQRMYSIGDYAGALEVWRALAEAGDVRAQYALGVLYANGQGVARDELEALSWFQRAAEAGSAEANRARRALEFRLYGTSRRDVSPPAPAPAPAPTPSPLGDLAEIEALLRDFLAQVDDQALGDGELSHGEIEIVPAEDGYRFRIPDFQVREPNGTIQTIGDVTGAVRAEGEDFYRIAVTMPARMTSDGSRGGKPQWLKIGRQDMAFQWHRALATVTNMSLRLADLEGGAVGQPPTFRIDGFDIVSNLVPERDLWSGPIEVRFSGLRSTDQADDGEVRMGEAGMRFDVSGLDMAATIAWQRELKSGAGKGDGTQNAFARLGQLVQGLGMRFFARDVDVAPRSGAKVRLAALEYGLSLDDLDQPLSMLALDFSHGGLAIDDPATPVEFMPESARLRLVLDSLPFELVLRHGIAAAIQMAVLGEVKGAPEVLEELHNELTIAGTQLRIEEGELTAPAARLRIGGAFDADAGAAFGVVGDLDLTVNGLDAMIAEAERQGGSGANLKAIAEKGESDPSDGSVRFHFRVQGDGKLLLNNQDLGPVLSQVFAGRDG